MRYGTNHRKAYVTKDVFGVDFHRFTASDNHSHHMEMAQTFGLSLGEIKKLKEKMTQT